MSLQSEMNAIVPRARKESLVITEIPDEVLVYDLKNDKAHCLNRPAAVVWANCDGKKTIAQVSQALERELGSPVNDETVWIAIDSLARHGLLHDPINKVAHKPRFSPRARAARTRRHVRILRTRPAAETFDDPSIGRLAHQRDLDKHRYPAAERPGRLHDVRHLSLSPCLLSSALEF